MATFIFIGNCLSMSSQSACGYNIRIHIYPRSGSRCMLTKDVIVPSSTRGCDLMNEYLEYSQDVLLIGCDLMK